MERIVSWNGSQGAKQSTGKTGQSQMMRLEYAVVVEMERKWCLQKRGWSWIDTSWMWEFREMEESRMTTQDSDLGGCLIQKIKRWVACIDFWERSLWQNYWEIGTRSWVDQCGIQERSDWWEGWCTVSLYVVLEAKVIGEVPPGEPRDWEKEGSHAQNLWGH